METDWQQIILFSLLGWVIFAFLAAAAFGWFGWHRKRKYDDREEAEYLNRWSEAKREQKKLPVFLRKQAD